ncbi:MAG: hypothetical protein JNM21_14505 [Taibaiella sp.]|nr:hypothetical protein [Taibaiella sp.]
MQDPYLELISLTMPEGLPDFFELVSVKKEEGVLCLYLEEENAPPEDLLSEELLSKGFFFNRTAQDFSKRGHNVFMHIKRRRSLRVKTGSVDNIYFKRKLN